MRPALLNPLFATLSSLSGIGARMTTLFDRVVSTPDMDGQPRVIDLLLTPPYNVIDRRSRPGVAEAADGEMATLELRVDRHVPAPRGRPNVPYRVYCHDDTGEIALVYFRGRSAWLEKLLPVDEHVIVSGRMNWYGGRPTMVHPDYVVKRDDAASLPEIEPVYPLTAGLSGRIYSKAIAEGLARIPELPEWLEPEFAARNNLPSFSSALHRLHQPAVPLDVNPQSPPWRRLALDEILAGQLALALVRSRMKRLSGRPFVSSGNALASVLAAVPYKLTGAQKRAVDEIVRDLSAPERMLRLLQGDVGSGKTIVALCAMAHVCDAGAQSALMVPTDILARQHFMTIEPIAREAGLTAILLTGRSKGNDRSRILEEISSGGVDIVIGTHALFQESVQFRDLGLVIIDEQHRFGVHQRLALTRKNLAPDMLVMTATPIPRTLVLTAFGDMDVSRLTEKPAGRSPVRTVVLPIGRLPELKSRIAAAIADGGKVYWIAPLVEMSEQSGLVSAEDRFDDLRKTFGDAVGIVHGRMKATEKDRTMNAFQAGDTRILVATTVIEVGVDIPDATIMVIEHAERFGLAQLHQLRGRVGRGEAQSSCILLYTEPLGETARARLAIMRETDDGFRIAEEDLRLRGQGDLLGTRQSGSPGFALARMEFHADLLQVARDDVQLLLRHDPQLDSERGEALRLLLYLFRRDDAIRLLHAG